MATAESAPRLFAAISVVTLAVLCGCAGYRAVEHPWCTDRDQSEFESTGVVKVGDRVRLTLRESDVVEGLLIELDEHVVTIADTAASVTLHTVETGDVIRFEVYRSSVGPTIAKVATAAGSSLIVYAIVKSHSGGTFEPDEAVSAKGY